MSEISNIIANSDNPLLRRAFLFIEEGDWEKADEYLEKVLDSEPENAYAYLGKLLVDFKSSSIDDLREQGEPLESNKNYKHIVRFADEELNALVTAVNSEITDRNESISEPEEVETRDRSSFSEESNEEDLIKLDSEEEDLIKLDSEEEVNKKEEAKEPKRKFKINPKRAGLIGGIIVLAIIAIFFIREILKDDFDHDMDNPHEATIHSLKYQYPDLWEKTDKDSLFVDESIEHAEYSRYNKDSKEFMGRMYIYYFGDDIDSFNPGDYYTDLKDAIQEKTLKVGDTDVTVKEYGTQINVTDEKGNTELTDTTFYIATFEEEYSRFAIVISALNNYYDSAFCDKIIESIDIDGYKNPHLPTDLEVEYSGDRTPGTVIESGDENVTVTAIYEDGEKEEVDAWSLDQNITLEQGVTSEATVTYHGVSKKLEVAGRKPVKLTVKYDGPISKGTVIEEGSKDVTVTVEYDTGEKEKVTDWTLDKAIKVKEGETSSATVSYQGVSQKLEVRGRKPVELIIKYDGDTDKGTVIKEGSEDVKVTVKYDTGEKEKVKNWKMDKKIKLKADETSTAKITAHGISGELKITCTTMSESGFKSKCQSYSYSDLLRDPNKYEGKFIKISGKVHQVIDENVDEYLVSTSGGYDNDIFVWDRRGESVDLTGSNIITGVIPLSGRRLGPPSGEKNIVEGDWITIYGVCDGNKTYTTVLFSERTVPAIDAYYIEIN